MIRREHTALGAHMQTTRSPQRGGLALLAAVTLVGVLVTTIIGRAGLATADPPTPEPTVAIYLTAVDDDFSSIPTADPAYSSSWPGITRPLITATYGVYIPTPDPNETVSPPAPPGG
jgi:hypothetical protein